MDYRQHQGRCGWHGHPRLFFPPFALLFGIGMMVMLFKTGLWIPLLVLGLVFWAKSQHHREGWGYGEKRKRDAWTWDDEPQKPKNDDYI